MKIIPSNKMKISLNPSQEKNISSREKIERSIGDKDILAFDLVDNATIIGFAIFRKFRKDAFFLVELGN